MYNSTKPVSLVRQNLMEREGYTPYCGGSLHFVRTVFNGSQFTCPECNFVTSFEAEFIDEYKKKWEKQSS